MDRDRPASPAATSAPEGRTASDRQSGGADGILFVLRSGLPWEMLPSELGCGSGMSCWRRLRDWQAVGVWARLHQVLLERPHAAGEIDWRRASLDSASVPAKKGGPAIGPNPTDRGKPGTNRHLVTDARGTPLGVKLTGPNRHDSSQMAPPLDAMPRRVVGSAGRGIVPRIARKD